MPPDVHCRVPNWRSVQYDRLCSHRHHSPLVRCGSADVRQDTAQSSHCLSRFFACCLDVFPKQEPSVQHNASTNGRWTHRLIPTVRTWVERRHGRVDYNLTQCLTGHGSFGQFLVRIGKREDADILIARERIPRSTLSSTAQGGRLGERYWRRDWTAS